MNKAKILCIIMGTAVLSASAAFAGTYGDISGHWAESAITKWSNQDILSGYNGMFRPDDTVTRGEMAVILDRVMKYTETSENIFTDLDQAFYTEPILKAVKAGTMIGSDNAVRPKELMTRQEAVVVLAKALGFDGLPTETSLPFTDTDEISDWAKGYVSQMYSRGYISGSDSGAFNPSAPISRAEVVSMLSNSIETIVTENGAVSSNNGKDVVINTPDVALNNSVVDGDLILSEGVGEGDVTLNNVTVKGRLVVRGGGVNTVRLENCIVGSISAEKKSSPVRILEEGSVVGNVDVKSSAVLEGSFDAVNIYNPSDLTVRGDIGTIEVYAKADIEAEGNIEAVNINEGAAETSVKGDGKVETVNIGAENVSVETDDTNVVVEKNISQAVVKGEAVKGGESKLSKAEKSEPEKAEDDKKTETESSDNDDGNSDSESSSSRLKIKNVESVSNSYVRVTLSKPTKETLTIDDFSIICTGGGSDMTILSVYTDDNKIYHLTTAYYKDNTYNLQVNVDGKYLYRDFVVKYDCAEIKSEKVDRISETAAIFTYVSDTPGTMYYAIKEHGAARMLFGGDNEPSAEELIKTGAKVDMALELNAIEIGGLKAETPYTLYYVAVDVKNRVTPVKQIEITPDVKPPVEEGAYQILEVVPNYNEKGDFFDENYWYTVTFDKPVAEELTLDNFVLTCPAQDDLTLGRVEKVNDTTYNVYMKVGSIPKDGNTFTMVVTFADGKTASKYFYFNTQAPEITLLNIERNSETSINVEFESSKGGYLYYKVYNESDYGFDSTEPKNPDDIFATGNKIELKYGLNNPLKDIEATAGQRFCFATENVSGNRSNTFDYSKPIEDYSMVSPEPEPDPEKLKITDVTVEADGDGRQTVLITFSKKIDILFDISSNDITFVGMGKQAYERQAIDEDEYGLSDKMSLKFLDPSVSLPSGENTVMIMVDGTALTFNFTV